MNKKIIFINANILLKEVSYRLDRNQIIELIENMSNLKIKDVMNE